MAETNPNGANQSLPDPRQEVCWGYYLESLAAGLPSAKASALKAGYEESSASQITVTSWFLERLDGLRRKGMRSKAERNLDKMLDTKWTAGEGEDGAPVPEVMRIVADVSKTVATRLGKDDGWSDRTELTGKNGEDLHVQIVSYADNNSVQISTPPIPDGDAKSD